MSNSSVREQQIGDMDEYYDDDMLDILNDVYQSYEADDMENVKPNTSNEEIRNDNNGFDNLFVEAGRKLYPGCKLSTLTFVIKLMHLKVLNHWSNKSLDMLLQLLGDVFPEGANIPKDTYSMKKMLRALGLREA
ncbi:uncharacterized protein LOC107410174 isoform X1 [Ziziphus jujuba]|uniref:Uncharacterized protein LOC107410174 isoform X1 n=1 Tax=Ziziphus jujuba TaxID=326968 RepID=A0ABM4AHF2_ZIZJJ|nr:uncharacterized protein LOC107410174 isoform X1 [Ziziphus jujuba]